MIGKDDSAGALAAEHAKHKQKYETKRDDIVARSATRKSQLKDFKKEIEEELDAHEALDL